MQKIRSIPLILLAVLILSGGLFLFSNPTEQTTHALTNEEVRTLQTFLKEQGLYKASINGKMTSATTISVKKFQKKYSLAQTGILNADTVKKIREISGGKIQLSVVITTPTPSATAIPTAKSTLLPLGDNKYSTSPKVGYIYSCQTNYSSNAPGAFQNGPWISGNFWDPSKKATVDGDVAWNGTFTNKISGDQRVFTGNNLPINHHTGTYPIAASDDAYNYDHNPNSIKEQTVSFSLPANPTLATSPSCIGGQVGIALSGVPIFNGFDAGGRDAVAHEVQDECDGHPQEKGQYHYHNASDCLKDSRSQPGGQSDLLGYAFDGFGIFGPYDENGKYLTNEDLDECHGRTSEIMWDGKKVTMYHYVATREFPYTVGCYRGTPIKQGLGADSMQPTTTQTQPSGRPGNMPPPPRQ